MKSGQPLDPVCAREDRARTFVSVAMPFGRRQMLLRNRA
jgi:hypothetical protein